MIKQSFATNALHNYLNVMDSENYKRLILLMDQAYTILKKKKNISWK